MKKHQFISKRDFDKFSNLLKNKIQEGFIIEEQNNKLPFAVLSKEAQVVNHRLNFLLFCVTLGMWSVVWLYIAQVSSRAKKILIALDEDGNTFEEKCYVG